MQHSSEHASSSSSGQPPTAVDRMAWCIEHSVMSVAATSATTIAAFAANMMASITPVRLFGVFMVILVCMNLVIVVLLLLAFLVIKERNSSKLNSTRAAQAAVAAAANARGSASRVGNNSHRFLGISFAGANELVPLTQTPTGATATITTSPDGPSEVVHVTTPHVHHAHEPYPMSLALTHPSERGANHTAFSPTSNFTPTNDHDEASFLLARPMPSKDSLEGSSTALSPRCSPDQTRLASPQSASPPSTFSPDGACVPNMLGSGSYSCRGSLSRSNNFLSNALGTFTCSVAPDFKDITCHAPTSGSAPGSVHKFLGGTYARWLYAWRHFVLLVTLIVVCFCAWRASQLELPHSRPTIWRKGSNMRSYYDLVRTISISNPPSPCIVTCSHPGIIGVASFFVFLTTNAQHQQMFADAARC
jgi:uncharacterized membrane protein